MKYPYSIKSSVWAITGWFVINGVAHIECVSLPLNVVFRFCCLYIFHTSNTLFLFFLIGFMLLERAVGNVVVYEEAEASVRHFSAELSAARCPRGVRCWPGWRRHLAPSGDGRVQTGSKQKGGGVFNEFLHQQGKWRKFEKSLYCLIFLP